MAPSDQIRQRQSLLEGLGWLAKSPAVGCAMMLLLAGAWFGSSRDVRMVLLSIPVLAFLLLATCAAELWASDIKTDRTRLLVAGAIICLTPLAYFCSYGLSQRVGFLLWAPAHYGQLAQASKKNGIIMGWYSWGWAGQDMFSYLVVDTQDQLESTARIKQWTRQIGQTCGLWEERRVWPRFYIVTTYTNCPYDGVRPAD